MILALLAPLNASQALPPLSNYNLNGLTEWRTEGHQWAFRSYWRKADVHGPETEDKLHLVFLDGQVVKRYRLDAERPAWEPWGPFIAAAVVNVRSPFERVVALRGAGGLGVHWDTVLYGFAGTTMTFLGRSPSLNANGPVLWKGQSDTWLFDDYDYYREMHEKRPVTRRFLFKVTTKGMKRIRTWKSTSKVRKVLHMPELE